MHVWKANYTRYAALVKRARRILCMGPAGPNGIRMLSRAFGIAVDSGGTLIPINTFVEAMNQNDISLDEADVEAVLAVLDRTGDRVIDPVDFIAALRQDLTPVKLTWVIRVWYTFKKSTDGTVLIDDILAAFSPVGYSEAFFGTRSQDDLFEEFQKSFNSTTNPDGVITRQEFEQYCSCIAGMCPDDVSFVTLMQGMWPAVNDVPHEHSALNVSKQKKSFDATFKASQTAFEKTTVNKLRQLAADLDSLMYDVHRPSIINTPLAVRELSLSLRQADTNRTYCLSQDAFTAALWSQRLYMKGREDLLFVLDTKGDGSVDYLLYMALLLPRLPPTRLMMLERIWELFPKDAYGTIDIVALHERFRANDGEEKDTFLSAWDVRRAIRRRVTLEELIEWYTPTSLKILMDKDFDVLLKRQWGLS